MIPIAHARDPFWSASVGILLMGENERKLRNDRVETQP